MTPARRSPRAEIVAVGSELLVPPRLDTNSLTVTDGLDRAGHPRRRQAHRRRSRRRAGPRDRRRAGARRPGRPDRRPRADRRRRHARRGGARGRPAADRGRGDHRQARSALRRARHPDAGDQSPPGAGRRGRRRARQQQRHRARAVGRGTARRCSILLPGPPRELKPMLETLLQGRLAARAPATRVLTRTVLVAGLGESHAEERCSRSTRVGRSRRADRGDDPGLGGTARAAALRARRCRRRRRSRCSRASTKWPACSGPHVISTDGRSIEAVVGALLAARGWRIAVAESCTGGLVTSRLTDIPGSSA